MIVRRLTTRLRPLLATYPAVALRAEKLFFVIFYRWKNTVKSNVNIPIWGGIYVSGLPIKLMHGGAGAGRS